MNIIIIDKKIEMQFVILGYDFSSVENSKEVKIVLVSRLRVHNTLLIKT